MSNASIVKYANVVEECITFSEPTVKNIQAKQTVPGQPAGAGTNYYEIPFKYRYGDRIDDFLMEWPEVHSMGGLTEKIGLSGRPEFSIMVPLPNKGQTQVVLEKLNLIHKAACKFVYQKKGIVKMFDFDAEKPGASFKNPIYYFRDKTTGEYIAGRDPAMFVKCFKRGFGAMEESTLFHRPVKVMKDGKQIISYEPIPWALVKNTEMRFIPLMHIRRISIVSGKASIQMEMVSAIVTYVAGRGTTSRQTDTLEQLVNTDASLISSLEEQIAKLTMARQSLLDASGIAASSSQQGGGQSTETNAGTMTNISGSASPPPAAALPPTPGGPMQMPAVPSAAPSAAPTVASSMTDFLAAHNTTVNQPAANPALPTMINVRAPPIRLQ